MNKGQIVIALPDQLGGIAALNHNLVEYTSLRNKVDLRIILYRDTSWTTPVFEDVFSWGEVIRFYFSSKENRFTILKRFSKLVGKGEGSLVCNDTLELEAEAIYPTGKKKFSLVHDFHNLRLSIRFYDIIDAFIAHSKLFHQVMMSSDPKQHHYYYLPHGVFIPEWSSKDYSAKLKIAFIGRLTNGKGVLKLYEINKILVAEGIEVEWCIIGNGELKEQLHQQWKDETNVSFHSPRTKAELLQLLVQPHVFVLPTEFEGSPVSILEAMSFGLVPVVSDLPGGIEEVVTKECGFKIPGATPELFVKQIALLNGDRSLLEQMSGNAYQKVKQGYNVKVTADTYFTLFSDTVRTKNTSPLKVDIGSRLDQRYLPNWLVTLIRR